MGKTKHQLSAIAITGAIVLIGTWAFAGGRWGSKGYGHPRHGYGYHPNPSKGQRGKLQIEQEKFSKETAELRREFYQKRLELRALLVDPKADPEKIKAKQGEVVKLKRKRQEKALEHRMATRELLPEEDFYHGSRGYGAGPCWRRSLKLEWGRAEGSTHMS